MATNTHAEVADKILHYLVSGEEVHYKRIIDDLFNDNDYIDLFTPENNSIISPERFYPLLEELTLEGLLTEKHHGFKITFKGVRVLNNGGYKQYDDTLQTKIKKQNDKLDAEIKFTKESIVYSRINLGFAFIATVFITLSYIDSCNDKTSSELGKIKDELNKIGEKITPDTNRLSLLKKKILEIETQIKKDTNLMSPTNKN